MNVYSDDVHNITHLLFSIFLWVIGACMWAHIDWRHRFDKGQTRSSWIRSQRSRPGEEKKSKTSIYLELLYTHRLDLGFAPRTKRSRTRIKERYITVQSVCLCRCRRWSMLMNRVRRKKRTVIALSLATSRCSCDVYNSFNDEISKLTLNLYNAPRSFLLSVCYLHQGILVKNYVRQRRREKNEINGELLKSNITSLLAKNETIWHSLVLSTNVRWNSTTTNATSNKNWAETQNDNLSCPDCKPWPSSSIITSFFFSHSLYVARRMLRDVDLEQIQG